MTNDDNRKTIRLSKYQADKINIILGTGKYLTEAELIRQALNIGLDTIHGELNHEM